MTPEESEALVQQFARGPYRMVITGGDADGYLAEAPELPGCITAGETVFEAAEMLRDAIEGWIEAALIAGEAIPEAAALRDPGFNRQSEIGNRNSLQVPQLRQPQEGVLELAVLGVVALVLAHAVPAVLLHQVPVVVDDEVRPRLHPRILVEHPVDPLAQPVQRHYPPDVHLAGGRPDIHVVAGLFQSAHRVMRAGTQEVHMLVDVHEGLVNVEEDVHVL